MDAISISLGRGIPKQISLTFTASPGKAERIDLGMYFIRFLTVHPDGQRIAFSSPGQKPPQPQVWVMENFLPR